MPFSPEKDPTDVRGFLGRMLFPGEDGVKKVNVLSGGVILFTSQDHQFIQTIANRIMEITPGGLIDKISTYDEYLENDEMARKRQILSVQAEEED